VVAVRDLDPYQMISVSDVKVVEFPLKSVHAQSIQSVKDILGQYAISRVFAGQMLLNRHLISSKVQPGISMEIPLEARGIFIPAEASRAVGGLINPGDRVDLIWSLKGASSYPEGGFAGSRTVVLGARVIQVIRDKPSGEFKGVIIAALPQTCERLAYYLETGSIYVALVPWGMQDSATIEAEVWPGK
jgi:Flp pilus assembly protein CpaB